MRKVIWTCWFQGRAEAPFLVRKCLESWASRNPDWDVRCLDARTIGRYIDLGDHIDLSRQEITAASLSDIVRILLLHEYGGVWADATLFCNRPLDAWLAERMKAGFFAFSRPAPDRALSSWFLAAEPGHPLVASWAAATVKYWSERERSDDYFWFHHLFGDLYHAERVVRQTWDKVPRIGAAGPHALQLQDIVGRDGSLSDAGVDPDIPVFKLRHDLNAEALRQGGIIHGLLAAVPSGPEPEPKHEAREVGEPSAFVGLKTKTENLGDHIQIIAGERLLKRAGISVGLRVDRDDGIRSDPALEALEGKAGILLNGWYKTNPEEWPPHEKLVPMYLGFHMRTWLCPTLVAPEAIRHYQEFGPIGCRDDFTLSLLREHGVDAFLSNCLSLCLPRRLPRRETQTEVLVVSRDRQILERLPAELGSATFISHYSGLHDFDANMRLAADVLAEYRDRARLIVTTLLHCALPALAMGIPVLLFYPLSPEWQRQSDRERFSTVERMIRIHSLDDTSQVDWSGQTPDVGAWKLGLIDAFFDLAARWTFREPVLGPIAPPESLPVPSAEEIQRVLALRDLEARTPDRKRWANPASYKPAWAERSRLAAALVPDGARVLEIGTGAGAFRRLVEPRCRYTGADLEPLAPDLIPLDLDRDPLPGDGFDYVVSLGVLEYLHRPEQALAKMCRAGSNILLSYCAVRKDAPAGDGLLARRERGWVNALSEEDLVHLLSLQGRRLITRQLLNRDHDFEQHLMVFAPT